jgi:hypothetical protein
MYLRPPSAREEATINDWIKVRQSGIRYYLSLGDQRIVDKIYIIRPKAEFEVKKFFPLLGCSINILVRIRSLLHYQAFVPRLLVFCFACVYLPA